MITTNFETLSASSEKVAVPALILAGERREDPTSQQLYEQGMKLIWDQVNQLPEGHGKVVLSQIWVLDKTKHQPTPKDFPALATHGFIVEHLSEGQTVWKPSSPYLKDFWHIGIHVSNAHGFTLQSNLAFQANLQARICLLFSTTG